MLICVCFIGNVLENVYLFVLYVMIILDQNSVKEYQDVLKDLHEEYFDELLLYNDEF